MQISLSLITILALVAGAYRYSVTSWSRTNLNDQKTVWLCKQPQTEQSTRLRVLKTAASTGGEYWEAEWLVQPGAPGFLKGKPGSPPMHIHKEGDETYSVYEGTAKIIIGGQETTLGPGGSVVLPAGTPHTIWNPSPTEDLLARISVSPPGPLAEHELEVVAGLSIDYGSINQINPLQMFLLFTDAGVQLVDILPAPLLRVAERVFPVVARYLGYKSIYPEYKMSPQVE